MNSSIPPRRFVVARSCVASMRRRERFAPRATPGRGAPGRRVQRRIVSPYTWLAMRVSARTRTLIAGLIAAGSVALVAGSESAVGLILRLEDALAPPPPPSGGPLFIPSYPLVNFPPYVGFLWTLVLLLVVSALTIAVTWGIPWLLSTRSTASGRPSRHGLAVAAGLGCGTIAGVAFGVGQSLLHGGSVDEWLSKEGPGMFAFCTALAFSPLADWLHNGAAGWLSITLAAAMPYALLAAPRRPRSERGPRCRACGYSLHGLTSARCPECGHALADPAPAHSAPIIRLLPSLLVIWPFVIWLYWVVHVPVILAHPFAFGGLMFILFTPLRPVTAVLLMLPARWTRIASVVGVTCLLLFDLRSVAVEACMPYQLAMPFDLLMQLGSDAFALVLAIRRMRKAAGPYR